MVEDLGLAPDEDGVAVPAHAAGPDFVRDGAVGGMVGDQLEGDRTLPRASAVVRLLQADDVGIELGEDGQDTLGAAQPVRADAFADVVAGDLDRSPRHAVHLFTLGLIAPVEHQPAERGTRRTRGQQYEAGVVAHRARHRGGATAIIVAAGVDGVARGGRGFVDQIADLVAHLAIAVLHGAHGLVEAALRLQLIIGGDLADLFLRLADNLLGGAFDPILVHALPPGG